MAKELLTTLDHVKLWLNITTSDTDDLLNLLISSASTFIMNYINRQFLKVATYEETYDGYGSQFMLLKQWPATQLNYLQFCGLNLTTPSTGNPRTQGYLLEKAEQVTGPQKVTLFGYRFPQGRSSIDVSYVAGYQTTESHSIPEGDPSALTTDAVWLGDLGVTYESTGVAMALVLSDPGVGEYTVTNDGTYGFNDSEAGVDIIISFSFVPSDIEQACYQLVAEQYLYKDRIGYLSKSLGGQETVSFSKESMTDYVSALLNPYKRNVPI